MPVVALARITDAERDVELLARQATRWESWGLQFGVMISLLSAVCSSDLALTIGLRWGLMSSVTATMGSMMSTVILLVITNERDRRTRDEHRTCEGRRLGHAVSSQFS